MRRLKRLALLLLLLILLPPVAVGLGWLLAGPDGVGRFVVAQAPRFGLPLSDARIDRLDLTGLELRAARLGEDGVVVDRVRLSWTPQRLWRERRLDRLDIVGATIPVEIAANGDLRIPGLIEPGAAGTGGLPALPVAEIVLRDSRLLVDSFAGPVEADLELRGWPDLAGGLAVTGTARASHLAGAAILPFDARIDADLSFEAGLTLSSDRLRHESVTLDRVEAWLTLAGRADRLTAIGGEISADRAAFDAWEVQALTLLIDGASGIDRLFARADFGSGLAHIAGDGGWSDAGLLAAVEIDSADLGVLLAALGIEAPATGAVRLSLDGLLPAALLDGVLSGDMPLDGRLAVRGRGLAWDGFGADGALDGLARWRFADGRLSLDGDGPWRLALTDPSLGPIALMLEGDAGAPQRLVLDGLGGGDAPTTVALSGGWTVLADAGQALGSIDGWWADDGQAELRRLDALSTPIRLNSWGSVRIDRIDLSGAGSDGFFAADAGATVLLEAVETDAVRLSDGSLGLTGTLDWDGDTLRLSAEECAALRLTGVEIAGGRLAEPLALCLTGGETPVAVATRTAQGWRTALSLAGEVPELALRVPEVGTVRLALGTVALLGTAAGQETGLAIQGSGGRLRWPDPALSLDGIAWEARVGEDAAAPLLTLRQAALRLPDVLAADRPLALSGTLRQEQGELRFAGSAVGPGGVPRLALSARHRADRGEGRADVTLAPLVFDPDGLQPADLTPLLAPLRLSLVRGEIAGQAHAAWDNHLRSGGTLRLSDLSFIAPAASFVDLDGDLNFASLVPPVLAPGQRVTVGLIDPGVTLTDGEAVFGMDADGIVAVETAGIDWAGGRLTARPFRYDPAEPEHRLTLDARDIDMTRVIAKVPLDGLFATGRASGTMPLRLSGDTILVEDAILESDGPGQVRYIADDGIAALASGDAAAALGLLLDVVRDFRYQSLVLRLSGEVGDELLAGMAIRGANPTVYDGYPVALNVTVSGALDQILRRSLEASRYVREAEEYLQRRAMGILTQDIDVRSGP